VPPTLRPLSGLLAWCRAGFEPELASELAERATFAGRSGFPRGERDSGIVLFIEHAAGEGDAWLPATDAPIAVTQAAPIFARQTLQLRAELRQLDPQDRITPLLAALGPAGPESPRYGTLMVEHPDSDAARPLAGLARAFGNALRPALRRAGWLSRTDASHLRQLHVALLSREHLLLAESGRNAGRAWPGGIPRLRAHADAPSRSALKLDEALLVLLDPDERERWLKPGMRAADLGAAPGGWSFVLARQHVRVVAVDNGPMAASAMATGLIEHLRDDGFRWHPREPLDWMVCDMVEQPRRVAARMAEWFRHGWCQRAIFNLKLPMKKRWEETRLCLDLFAEQSQRPLEIRARQLYHDREEITVYAGPPALRTRPAAR
jgi:23S rRNA (cytidine2498-2'-O)-methyltransferase